MITVYVRHCNKSEGYVLGEFEPESLARLCQVFKEYPTYASIEEETAIFSAAQFVCDEAGAYFEIIVETQTE